MFLLNIIIFLILYIIILDLIILHFIFRIIISIMIYMMNKFNREYRLLEGAIFFFLWAYLKWHFNPHKVGYGNPATIVKYFFSKTLTTKSHPDVLQLQQALTSLPLYGKRNICTCSHAEVASFLNTTLHARHFCLHIHHSGASLASIFEKNRFALPGTDDEVGIVASLANSTKSSGSPARLRRVNGACETNSCWARSHWTESAFGKPITSAQHMLKTGKQRYSPLKIMIAWATIVKYPLAGRGRPSRS